MDSWHLIFPLLSSLLFVAAAMFAKRASHLGITPYTATALSNFVLALCWMTIGSVRGEWLSSSGWFSAAWIAIAFIGGQLTTFLAFRFGDVSLATPVFGVKIIMVAILSSLIADRPIEIKIWIAAVLATIGIAVVQFGPGASKAEKLTTGRALASVGFAFTAATLFSFFDVGVQAAGKQFGAPRFLTTMFCFVGVLSLGLLPWSNKPSSIQKMKALRPLSLAALFMAAQAMSITFSLGQFGDATRINIVYSLRGLWSVVLAWLLTRLGQSPEMTASPQTLLYRFIGALLLMTAVVVALTQ